MHIVLSTNQHYYIYLKDLNKFWLLIIIKESMKKAVLATWTTTLLIAVLFCTEWGAPRPVRSPRYRTRKKFLYTYLQIFMYFFVSLPPRRRQPTVLCHSRILPNQKLSEFAVAKRCPNKKTVWRRNTYCLL